MSALACMGVLLLIVVFGPAADGADRIAGIISLGATVALMCVMAATASRPRAAMGASTVILSVICVVGVAVVAPEQDTGGVLGRLAAIGPPRPEFLHPHVIGLAAVVASLLGLALATDRTSTARHTIGWLAVAVMDVLLVLSSGSRTGVAGLAVGGIVLAEASWLGDRRRALMLAIATTGLALVAVGIVFAADAHLGDRLRIWGLTYDGLKASPIVGSGYGGMPYFYVRAIPLPWERVTNAHDLLLQTYSDFGLLGLATILVLILGAVRRAMWTSVAEVRFRMFLACMSALLVIGVAESVVDATIGSGPEFITVVSPLLFVVTAAVQTLDRRSVQIRWLERPAVA